MFSLENVCPVWETSRRKLLHLINGFGFYEDAQRQKLLLSMGNLSIFAVDCSSGETVIAFGISYFCLGNRYCLWETHVESGK